MSIITKVLSGGIGALIGQVKDVVDEFNLSGEEKNDFTAKMESLFQKRDSEIEQTIRVELQAKERIMVAEMQQGDNYTKRARPTVVYGGLAMMFLNYFIIPLTNSAPVDLPTEFWVAWGGVVGVYSLGRSAEKRGNRSSLVKAVTGNKPYTSILD